MREVQSADKHMTMAQPGHSQQEAPGALPRVKAGNRIDIDCDDLRNGKTADKKER